MNNHGATLTWSVRPRVKFDTSSGVLARFQLTVLKILGDRGLKGALLASLKE